MQNMKGEIEAKERTESVATRGVGLPIVCDSTSDLESTAVMSGWLLKKGGGTTVFGRTNWKRRWFILYSSGKLTYQKSDKAGAEKILGEIDFQTVTAVRFTVKCA